MFRKRVKKSFPEGTFIPFPARMCAILQLCIAFGMLLWYAAQPFMGELFEIKSQKLLIHYALDHPEQFAQLPLSEQKFLQERSALLQQRLEISFFQKLKKSVQTIAALPLLKLCWVILSIILSLFLLKKKEGAAQALWLLPFLALAYGIDNRLNAPPAALSAEERLFPSESYLAEYYLDEPFSSQLFEQRKQLEQAWNHYLDREWGGLYAFNLARIHTLHLESAHGPTQEASLLLFLFLFWNLSYAFISNQNYKLNFPSNNI